MLKRFNQSIRLLSTIRETKIKTAGIIVIGDEILKGEVIDTNSHYVTKLLHKQGIHMKKISVIGDYIDEIGQEVKLFSKTYDYVITTGGIGPTHDDVTFEAIAKAFDEPLVPHPHLVKICQKFYKTKDLTSPGMKLAYVPKSSKLTFPATDKPSYPNISIKNVYIFPGIPELLTRSFNLLAPLLFKSDIKFYTKKIFFNVTENMIVNAMDTIVKDFPKVNVGSYPEITNKYYKVKVTIESQDETSTEEAFNKLLSIVPKNYVVNTK